MVKPKLTPEEKKQLKIQKKIEKKKRAEEKKKQVKRDYLARELSYGILSKKQVEKRWREILHNVKLKDLSIEFELAVINAERVLDAKDLIISILLDELHEAELQYEMNLKSHCTKLDEIYDLYLKQLDDLKLDYESGINYLIKCMYQEIIDLNAKAKKEEEYLCTLQFGNDKLSKQLQYETTVNRLKYIEEMKHEYMECENRTAETLEKKFMSYWNLCKNVIQQFKDDSNAKRKEYDEMAGANSNCVDIITTNRTQLFQQYVCLKKIKDRQEHDREAFETKIKFYSSELHAFKDLMNQMKRKLDKDEASDYQQLTYLTKQMNYAKKVLKNKINDAEKILKLYGITRKYVSVNEMIFPFPKLLPEHIPRALRWTQKSEVETAGMKEFVNFWQLVARSDKWRIVLNEEMEALKLENKKLKKLILQHLHMDPSRVTKIQGINMQLLCKRQSNL